MFPKVASFDGGNNNKKVKKKKKKISGSRVKSKSQGSESEPPRGVASCELA